MGAATALSLFAAGTALYGALKQPKPSAVTPTLPELPPAPDPAAAADAQGAALSRTKGKAAVAGALTPPKAGTLLTGPAGLSAPATTERKTLLGA